MTITANDDNNQPTCHCDGCGKRLHADELTVMQGMNNTYDEAESFAFCAECAEADAQAERDAYFPTAYWD